MRQNEFEGNLENLRKLVGIGFNKAKPMLDVYQCGAIGD